MKIVINDNIDKGKWKELININKYSTPFQTNEFYELYNGLEGHSADVFAIEDNNEYKILCVVIIQKESGFKGYFSRRGIVYGGPLINTDNSNYLTIILKAINDYYRKKLIYLEIRNSFEYSDNKTEFENESFKYVPWLNFQMDTTNLDKIKISMNKTRLRQISKAIKSGATVIESKSLNDVNAFYTILKNIYDKKIKKPLLPKSFFTDHIKEEMCKYFIVHYNNKVLGGLKSFILPNKAMYALYVCGLDQEYKNQRPSILAYWGAINYANQNNLPLFDFMGAGSPDKDYGVRVFKSRFGGELVEHGRFRNIYNPLLYKIGEIGLYILSKIK